MGKKKRGDRMRRLNPIKLGNLKGNNNKCSRGEEMKDIDDEQQK